MLEQDILIQNKLGLHARAAMKLVDLAARYSCAIYFLKDGRQYDLKDIMVVLSLGAIQGTPFCLQVDGEEEADALEKICALIDDKFGEGE